jgi:hypothetical protein
MTFTLEELGQRLRELPLQTPDARRATAIALGAPTRREQAPPRRPLNPWLLRPVAAVVVLAFVWVVLYFSPAAGAAIAGTPVVGHVSSFVLDQAGLGTGTAVTSEDAAAAHSGVTVHLLGATASPLRTVLLVRFTPATYVPAGVTLTDQFGTSYEDRSGVGDTRTGDWALIFAPPSFGAGPLGMRYTLTFNTFSDGQGNLVRGIWTVSGTVLPHTGRTVHAPAAASIGSGKITFVDGTEADGVLQITAHASGLGDLGLPQRKQVPGEQAFSVTVTDSKGKTLAVPVAVQGEEGGWAIDITAYGVADHGSYRIDISIPGVGTVSRTVSY